MIAVFHDDAPEFISHMSSGDNEEWCEEVTISAGEWNNPGDEPLVRGECGSHRCSAQRRSARIADGGLRGR